MLAKSEIATRAFAAIIKGILLPTFLEEFKNYPDNLKNYAEVKYNLQFKRNKNKPKCYTRAGILTPKKVFENLGKQLKMFGVIVNFDSIRYNVYYKKGMKCSVCGLEGQYFAVEKNKAQIDCQKYHLNL